MYVSLHTYINVCKSIFHTFFQKNHIIQLMCTIYAQHISVLCHLCDTGGTGNILPERLQIMFYFGVCNSLCAAGED